MTEAALPTVQTAESPVIGIVTPEVAQHMGEAGITNLEKEAVIRTLGEIPTEQSVVLVANVEKDGKLEPHHFVSVSENAFGEEVLPEDAAQQGLQDPHDALKVIQGRNYPHEVEPVGLQQVGTALFMDTPFPKEPPTKPL